MAVGAETRHDFLVRGPTSSELTTDFMRFYCFLNLYYLNIITKEAENVSSKLSILRKYSICSESTN